jgi:REP element-mobilizing transposase RayT
MARQARLDAPGTLHHVMGRGIEGTNIFRKNTDREDFLSRLSDLCKGEALKVYAWALLGNHFHLLARTGKEPLSINMRKLLTGYAVNFNRRHKRYGHLFQNRYKSIICQDDPYLLELTRYIHLNPLRVGIVKNLEELNEYRWCGHSVIMGKVKREWQDQDTILVYFGKRKRAAIIEYGSFIEKGILQGRRPELVGGGLVRSLGGWSQVLSLRRSGRKAYSDDRVLGSSDFVQDVLLEAEEKVQETLRLNLKISDLSTLAGKICERIGIEESDLRSGLRQRLVAKARRLFAQIAVKKMGYSGAEVARFLGVTTSAVNRLAAYEEEEEVKTFT